MPATASAELSRADEHEGAEPGEEAHDHVDAERDPADVEAGEPRRFRIAADRIDLPAVARVAQHDMGEDGEGEEDDDRHRHLPEDAALAPPDEIRVEAADRPAAGEEQRRAAEHRHAAERHDEGRHLEPGDGEPCRKPPSRPTAIAASAARYQP